MRIDHSNAEITKTNTSMETRGSKAVSSREGDAKEEYASLQSSRSVKKTTVEKTLFSLDSELDKIRQAASDIDVDQIKKQMAVLSNTVSPEDLKKLQENGFSLNDTQIDTIVTVMDKIKMELAKGGMDISVFGEDYSMQQLEAITGSAAQARQMNDSLTPCEDGDIKYMVENELEPTVENLYWAQHSNSAAVPGNADALKEETSLLPQVEQAVLEAGLPVNDTTLTYGSFLLNNDLPVTAQNLKYVSQLKETQLPAGEQELNKAMSQAVTEGNQMKDALLAEGFCLKDRAIQAAETVEQASGEDLAYLIEHDKTICIESLRQAQNFRKSETEGEGKDTQNDAGSVIEGKTDVTRKAADQTGDISITEEDVRFIKARRQLEEIRLAMTVQANYHLLKQGISIETEDLENLVEDLKGIETDYYQSLLKQNGIEPSTENAALLQETIEKTDALKEYPAYALGREPVHRATVDTLYEAGREIKSSMEAAGQAYEAMKTEPRSDLGDSVQKAFRNVDAILTDLNLENTQANQRAVRILGYNGLEITTDSISQMKAADQKVQLLFDNLTPSVVLEMIREGVNPLETDISTLNQKAEEIKGELDPGKEEKFSEYLWKLEQKQEITPEERESYIGIYRMLHQIEKTDGAVIGALVNQGGDLSLKNLLTAVRSGKKRGIDVRADETFGAVTELEQKGTDITKQVEAAYQTDCAKEAFSRLTQEGMEQCMANKGWQDLTPEQLLWQMKERVRDESREDYQKEQLREFAASQKAEAAVVRMLADYDVPVTAYNMLAAEQMMNQRNGIFRRLFDPANLEKNPDLSEVKEQILLDFAEAVKTPEEMAKAQQALADTAEQVMETMISEEQATSLDVRDLKILRQEIELGTKMAKEETYAVPVMIADELTNVQLKIVRGKRSKGRVDIMFETDRLGKVAARLQAEEGKMTGYAASDSRETLELLKQQESELQTALGQSDENAVRFDFIQSSTLDLNAFSPGREKAGETDPQSDIYQVQTKQLYGMAKGFLEAIKGISSDRP